MGKKDLNTATLIGRLTKDAETITLPSGTVKAEGSLAVNDYYNNEERADFFEFAAFGRMAEALSPYLQKGTLIALSGRLRQERWQTADGGNRSKVVINADSIQLLGGKRD